MALNTVNLTQFTVLFPSGVLISSRYRCMQRFFSQHSINYNTVARFVMALNKRSNSNSRERIALLKRFIGQFGRVHIIKAFWLIMNLLVIAGWVGCSYKRFHSSFESVTVVIRRISRVKVLVWMVCFIR